jgi:hypothetical protein
MSSQPNETFNPNLLPSSSAESIGSEVGGDDGNSLAAQLAGGGSEFVIPTQRKALSKSTIGFIIVAVLAAGSLWWMKQRTGGPAPAEAKDPNLDAARNSIQQFLAGGSGSVEEMKNLLADSEQITDKFSTYSENRQVPLDALKTNPFFMEMGEEPAPAPAPRIDLSRQQAEARLRELERLKSAAQRHQVQTIFFGRNPTAMIDGKICQVGNKLGEFIITAIRADAVVINGGGQDFELRLKQ